MKKTGNGAEEGDGVEDSGSINITPEYWKMEFEVPNRQPAPKGANMGGLMSSILGAFFGGTPGPDARAGSGSPASQGEERGPSFSEADLMEAVRRAMDMVRGQDMFPPVFPTRRQPAEGAAAAPGNADVPPVIREVLESKEFKGFLDKLFGDK